MTEAGLCEIEFDGKVPDRIETLAPMCDEPFGPNAGAAFHLTTAEHLIAAADGRTFRTILAGTGTDGLSICFRSAGLPGLIREFGRFRDGGHSGRHICKNMWPWRYARKASGKTVP